MSRPRTLDREKLLDAAETVVTRDGTAGLTFGSLATTAAVPKASVQSAFGSREALLDALLNRWLRREQARFEAELGHRTTARDRMLAHIRVTSGLPQDECENLAALLAALAGGGGAEEGIAQWYRSRVGSLAAEDDEARQLRIGFLACEGAYCLRYVFKFPMSDALWRDIFADLLRYTANTEAPPRPST